MEIDPLWYKKALIYELHLRAFHDSNGDGHLSKTEFSEFLADVVRKLELADAEAAAGLKPQAPSQEK